MKSFFTIILVLFASAALAQPVEEWVARYNGPGNGGDWATALAVDAEGNVYVTGSSTGSGSYSDYATVKYDHNGNQLWVARYNGPENDRDEAKALTVDASGNVYVTGWDGAYVSCPDYATIKYDCDGNQLWVARYNGPENEYGIALALAVDASGNVYVTGQTFDSATLYDYGTIKYAPNGNELWVALYNGPGNCGHAECDEGAEALALDAFGNVYVTGWSETTETNVDYATIKYDSNGNQLWVARYDGPANSEEFPLALAVDASSNVYVTGKSYGSGTDWDYATIKYDSHGNQLWVARYNGPGNGVDRAYALAVDASGNVYVTGCTEIDFPNYDYATIKYDPEGNQLWVVRYNGPGNESDRAEALAVDASGGVYVTGWSEGSGTSRDCATIKYDTNGNQLWVARYNGPGNGADYANALALNDSGNVYITGYSYGDYATIKYGPPLWSVYGFLNGDNDLERFIVHDLDEMELVGSSDSVCIYAVIDRIPGRYGGHNDWVDSKVYKVQQDDDMTAFNSTVIREDFENDMGEEDSLSAFFVQARARVPARHYVLTIHNHGDGWYKGKDGWPLMPTISDDSTNHSSIEISNGEWESAISAIKDNLGRKLDLLLFDACLMQMWEVAYINREYVEVQVGSEEIEIGFPGTGVGGVAHNNWLDSLTANPARPAVSLGRAIVQTAPSSGGTLFTQSALDLSQIENLTNAIDAFALSLIDALGDYGSIIESHRAACLEFEIPTHIDIWDFADRIRGDGQLPEDLRNTASTVKAAVGSTVIENYNAGGQYQRTQGVAIYFPRADQAYDYRYDNLNSSASTHWDEFLKSLRSVEVTIVPHNPPIQIPPEGGSFQYDATITNNTDNSVTVDTWTMARLPNQSCHGPLKLYENIPLAPHHSRSANNIRQNVPGYAPAGEYRYIAFVGQHPDVKLDSSYFDLTKLGKVDSYSSKVTSWEVFGFFEETPSEPLATGLHTVYPNPFNTQANVSYSIVNPSWVRLVVFDILGRKVATLVDSERPAGEHSVVWDASRQASGVYFYKLTAGDFTQVRRMTLLK